MIHMLLFLPAREGLTIAERFETGGSFYVPTCKVPGATINTPAPVEFIATCLGHTDDDSVVDCPACKPEVARFLDEQPGMKFSYGILPT